MAFSVTADHARQEQVWEGVNKSGYDEPYQIRRRSDRACGAGLRQARPLRRRRRPMRQPAATYCAISSRRTAAAGSKTSLCSSVFSPRNCAPKPRPIATEGWKWIEVAPSFPYGHDHGLRRLEGEYRPISPPRSRRAFDALPSRVRRRFRPEVRGCRRNARRSGHAPRRARAGPRSLRRTGRISLTPAAIVARRRLRQHRY